MSALPTHDIVTGGEFAINSGIVYIKTPCCDADATGSGDGIVCRACRAPLADGFGWAAMERSFQADYAKYLLHVAEQKRQAYYAAREALDKHVVSAHSGNWTGLWDCPECSRNSVLHTAYREADIAWTSHLAEMREVTA